MEKLQTIAVLLPILVALFGAGVSIFTWYAAPDFNNGKYYEAAWIQYETEHNDLYVEYVPDGTGYRVILAASEAARRIAVKADLNNNIDGKPLVIHVLMLGKGKTYETGQIVIRGKWINMIADLGRLDRETRIRAINESLNYVTFNPPPAESYIAIDMNGEPILIDTETHTEETMNADNMRRIVTSDSFNDAVQRLR